MLTYKVGDLCEAHEPVIIQGCNAQGVMGSGVAKALRNKFPQVYTEYMTEHRREKLRLGYVVATKIHPSKWICSIISQRTYGTDGKKYAQYSALVKGFTEVRRLCYESCFHTIATPMIGCGLGGLQWEFVSELLEENFVEYDIGVTVYTQ